MGSTIRSLGAALPSTRVGNDELGRRFGVDPDWIVRRTGIGERYALGSDERLATLAAEAARRALENGGLEADVDAVIGVTLTPDLRSPGLALEVQGELGLTGAAFDLNAACAGPVVALAQAHSLIGTGLASKVLIVCAEAAGRSVDPDDVNTAIIFGDGAAALVVEETPGEGDRGAFYFDSDPAARDLVFLPQSGVIAMSGTELYRRTVAMMHRCSEQLLERNNLKMKDIGLYVAHQGNGRILEVVAQRLELEPQQVLSDVGRVGNTGSASMAVALEHAAHTGRIEKGDLVMLAGIGAGLVWAGAILRWPLERGSLGNGPR